MEKQLEALKKALVMGAVISVHFHEEDREEAERKFTAITDELKLKSKHKEKKESNHAWFTTGVIRENKHSQIEVTAHYDMK